MSQYNYDQIQEVIADAACCLATKNAARITAENNGEDADCLLYEAFRLMDWIDVLTRHIPGGTITGYIIDADADIDMTGTIVGGTMSGIIEFTYSGGTILIGAFAGTYATISDLIDAIIAALQGGWSGVNNDPILTITAPTNLGFNPLSGVITITLAPFFEKDTGVETATEPRGSCTVNTPLSPMYGYTFIANYNTHTVGVWNYDVFVTNIALPAGSFPNDCCHDPVNDRIYVPCVGRAVTEVIDNTLTLMAGAPYPLATGAVSVRCVYNRFNNCKYIAAAGANRVVKLDGVDAMTIIGGFNSPDPMEINQYNGEIWIGGSGINRLYILDPTTDAILQQINTATTISSSFAFYPGADATTGRMFISNFLAIAIEEWDLTATIINATYITTLSTPNSVFYSALFDRLFVGIGNWISAYYINGNPDTVPVPGFRPPIAITSISYIGVNVSVTTVSPHGMVLGDTFIINGVTAIAVPGTITNINGAIYSVTVAGVNTFTFVVGVVPTGTADPNTGTVEGTPSPHTTSDMGDDYAHEALTRIVNPAGADHDLEFYTLDAPQIKVGGDFDGTVTEILQTAAMNCLENPDIIISNIKGVCGCCSHEDTTTDESVLLILQGQNNQQYIDANGSPILLTP